MQTDKFKPQIFGAYVLISSLYNATHAQSKTIGNRNMAATPKPLAFLQANESSAFKTRIRLVCQLAWIGNIDNGEEGNRAAQPCGVQCYSGGHESSDRARPCHVNAALKAPALVTLKTTPHCNHLQPYHNPLRSNSQPTNRTNNSASLPCNCA